jgi:hypothetical protein
MLGGAWKWAHRGVNRSENFVLMQPVDPGKNSQTNLPVFCPKSYETQNSKEISREFSLN